MLPILQIENLNVYLRTEEENTAILQDLSFNIFPGEMVAVVGESGSGKSMTALAIMKLLPANAQMSGKVLFGEPAINITEANEKLMRDIRGGSIAMIFQEPMTSLNPLIRCGDQILESVRLHNKSKSKDHLDICAELMEKTGLLPAKELMGKFPHQLSGGQRQRVMIAMALAGNPSLLIADEPTTALDPVIQHSILQLLQKLQKDLKLALLLITHDMGVAADFSDRILVMKNGSVIESASTDEIFRHPNEPYTRRMIDKKMPLFQTGKISSEVENIPESKAFDVKKDEFIRIDNLTAIFRKEKKSSSEPFKVLDNISFKIEKNEILGLVGESGSGKSTIAKILTGLMSPESGIITVEKRSLSSLLSEKKGENLGRFQLIFQDPYGSLNPRLTIGNAIGEAIKKHSANTSHIVISKKTISLLNEVGLTEEFLFRYPHELSGGQRQRVCIARAMACVPLFIVFDESLSALDASLQEEMLKLIKSLQQEFGFSALFISHDLELVCRISSRILVLQKGRLVEEAATEGFFEQRHHPYTQLLIEAILGKKIRQ